MRNSASIVLSVGIMAMSGYGIFAASAWPWKAALFPLAIGIPLFCLAASELLWTLFGKPAAADGMEIDPATHPEARPRILAAASWMLGFFAAIALLGFPIAVPLFLFLYLKIQGGEGWILSIVVTVVVSALFYGLFDALLHLPFPAGWVWQWLGLA